ncbi:hypothetical protein Nepgr_013053 [Nepenthes gracilis]|uniref:Uncharacterized protein n=1 Tax=Nepenthes gracilis TaxID=150966 RepID=A0AAD3SHE5_NEPGR|nr:hypothetical protein Nepgr_013053 [Nepenthes gracilis]
MLRPSKLTGQSIESQYFVDTSTIESGQKGLEEALHNWYRTDSLQFGSGACRNPHSVMIPSNEGLRGLRSGHHNKIVEIAEYAGKFLPE